MKLLITLPLLGLALAQSYGPGDTGPVYPPAQAPANPSYSPGQTGYWPQPQYGHQGHHRSRSSSSSGSRSRSRSHSREHNKCRCKKLKREEGNGFNKVTIKDLKSRNGCDRVAVSCPFNNDNYVMYGINGKNENRQLSQGQYIQRIVKCNKKGRWEADSFQKDGYTFKSVGCQILRIVPLPVAICDSRNATSEINVVELPAIASN